jgi:signal transduction histidine kinase
MNHADRTAAHRADPTARPAPAEPIAAHRSSGEVARGGLRLRLTLLFTALLALVGGLLLALAYLLVARVVGALPQLPPGTPVMVNGTMTDAAAVTAEVTEQGRRTVLVVGLIAFAVEVIAGAVVSWVLVGRALRPLATLTRAARTLSESSLDQRISLSGPRDEVALLADTFDEMTDRLQAAFDAERRFVANASHELRTPLAVIRTEIDVTLADPAATVADLRRMGEVARQATERADALVSALLLLARTQARGLTERREVDLADLPGPALAAVAADRTAKDLAVTVSARPAPVVGDRVLLDRLAGNLVENAVRHNVSGGWIRVDTGVRDGDAWLTVAASGPEVDPATAAQLFEPFRQGRSRTGRAGTGLGLSIVRAIAQAHGGTAQATAVPGGGLEVSVTVPARPGSPAGASR